jgi:hydroxymethylpyrimidine/phosphomethylpyrimidine kinase
MRGRVLVVAGSDSGGGAGIQADIKAVTALEGFAATAVTALTAQNTLGVLEILDVPPAFVARQMEAVLSDIGADCIKTGMLHTAGIIEAVADVIARDAPDTPLVVDPVMVAKSGTPLLEPAALEALKRRLVKTATVLTPNAPEAEALTGTRIRDVEGMKQAAKEIQAIGPKAVLLTGGHVPGGVVTDVLADGERVEVFEGPRVETRHTHGTGCTLASAIATGLAQNLSIRDAVMRARAYVLEAIRSAPALGQGRGPLDHAHTVRPFKGGT